MNATLGFDVCGVRKFGRFKVPDMAAVYLRFVLLFVFCVCNAKQLARSLVASNVLLILHVHRTRNFAKICKAVVRRAAVDMINIQSRPYFIAVKPRKPVCVEPSAIENYFMVSVCPDRTTRCANRNASTTHETRENACPGVVENHLSQACERYTFGSHNAVLSQSGQEPGSAATLPWFRLV